MKNKRLAIVEKHNEILERIRIANSTEDMRQLFIDVKEFVAMYKEIDVDAVNRIYERYTVRLQAMLDENDVMFNNLSNKAETIGNREYDFIYEKDDTLAVQRMVLQIMGQLPNEKSLANKGKIANVIEQAIRSGSVGCKAVLELMKYPVYLDMIDESQKHNAFIGSKSKAQQSFERLKEKELQEVEKKRADIYLKGFHLRNLKKRVDIIKKTSAFA